MIGADFFAARKQVCAPDEVAAVPNSPAVFLIWADEGAPYLARTSVLRRRLTRLLGAAAKPSRFVNLRGVARRVEYWLSGSRLESSILFYSLAREHYPDNYEKVAKLRMPPFVKLTLANRFPRTLVTTRLAGRGLFYGPFRSRASADLFGAQMLDLFQVRRCEENLEPDPAHPGCMYGEMNMCLRPCQAIVSDQEYASEVGRLQQFLTTGGASLLESITHARDRSSEALDFEEAARQHKRYERVQGVLGLRDELVRDVDSLFGLAVTTTSEPETVTLWFMLAGRWADPVDFPLAAPGSEIVSLDHRLRAVVAAIGEPRVAALERQEHVALLARWYYSSWRDGEWLGFESLDRLPYRKAVNAIARVGKAARV
jgi:excinuclease UvrABC nuclease subunit